MRKKKIRRMSLVMTSHESYFGALFLLVSDVSHGQAAAFFGFACVEAPSTAEALSIAAWLNGLSCIRNTSRPL